MKSHKHIVLPCCLLLWAFMLCTFNCVAAELVPTPQKSYSSGKAVEQLSGEEPGDSVAWLEQSVPPAAAASPDHSLAILQLAYSLLFCTFRPSYPRPPKATHGFSSLFQWFRILPNAP